MDIKRTWDEVRAECEAPDGGTMPCACSYVRDAFPPHRKPDPDCVMCHGLGWINRPTLMSAPARPASIEEQELLARGYRAFKYVPDPALKRPA